MLKLQTSFNAIAVRGGFALAAPWTLILVVVHGPLKGVLLGIGSGILFGVCLSIYIKRQFKAFSSQHQSIQAEPVIKRVMANHLVNGESRNGQLMMTQNWLGFRAHENNFNRAPIEMPFSGIIAVETSQNALRISNKLNITVVNGLKLEFVVWESREWMHAIKSRLTN